MILLTHLMKACVFSDDDGRIECVIATPQGEGLGETGAGRPSGTQRSRGEGRSWPATHTQTRSDLLSSPPPPSQMVWPGQEGGREGGGEGERERVCVCVRENESKGVSERQA